MTEVTSEVAINSDAPEGPTLDASLALLSKSIGKNTSTLASSLSFTLECRARNYDPATVMDDVTHNSQALQRLTDTANLRHGHSYDKRLEALVSEGHKPARAAENINIPSGVTIDQIRKLTTDITYFVDMATILTDEEVRYALEKYEDYVKRDKYQNKVRDEDRYQAFFTLFVEDKEIKIAKERRKTEKAQRKLKGEERKGTERTTKPFWMRRPLGRPPGKHRVAVSTDSDTSQELVGQQS